MKSSSRYTILKMASSGKMPGSNTARITPIQSSKHMLGWILTTPMAYLIEEAGASRTIVEL